MILSLIVVAQWKKRWSLGWLLVISFVLLLFGATETYYGVLPLTLQRIISYYYNIFFTTRNFLSLACFMCVGLLFGLKKTGVCQLLFGKAADFHHAIGV